MRACAVCLSMPTNRPTQPVPAQMWQGGPSPGADVAGVGPVPEQMWPGCSQAMDPIHQTVLAHLLHSTSGSVQPQQEWWWSRPAGPVPEQMWQGWAQSRCRCGRGGPSPGADVGGVGAIPEQMWQGHA